MMLGGRDQSAASIYTALIKFEVGSRLWREKPSCPVCSLSSVVCVIYLKLYSITLFIAEF